MTSLCAQLPTSESSSLVRVFVGVSSFFFFRWLIVRASNMRHRKQKREAMLLHEFQSYKYN